MTSLKSQTNRKWTSNRDYRDNHAAIFGFKPGANVEFFVDGFGILSGSVVSRNGDTYVVKVSEGTEHGGAEFEVEVGFISNAV